MKIINYKNILLETSVAAITSDGYIDESEIKALKNIEKNSPYFSSEDLSDDLEKLLKKCSLDIVEFQKSVFKKIINADLNLLQELTLLEISLRIISADNKEEKVEKEFIVNLRKCLKISDLLIFQRFGKIEYLGILDFEQNFTDFVDPDQLDTN